VADVVGACFVVKEGPLCVALALGAEVRGGFVGVVAGGEPPGDRFEGPIAAKLRPLFKNEVPVELRADPELWQKEQVAPAPYVVLY